MRIDVELTDEERDALLFLLGSGTGNAVRMEMPMVAKAGVRLMNKMFAGSPEYVPYDENSFNPESGLFPFKMMGPQ